MHDDLKSFFLDPPTPKQRQYEALRAYVVEGLPARESAHRFGFTEKSLYALAHDLRTGDLEFFPSLSPGPKERRTTPYLCQRISEWREQGLSVEEIVDRLREEHIERSPSTVERILKDAGFGKLPRRSAAQRGWSGNHTLLPPSAQELDMATREPFRGDCQVAGIFVFLPYLVESGIWEVLDALPLPESGVIGKKPAVLSFLALKLMGGERVSHVRQYDHDVGFGLFAGLNVLPKPTYMGTYSCRLTADLCHQLQKSLIARLQKWDP